MKIPWISSLLSPLVEWWRDWSGQSVSKYRVWDLREQREEEAAREVRILRLQEEQDRIRSDKAKRDAEKR